MKKQSEADTPVNQFFDSENGIQYVFRKQDFQNPKNELERELFQKEKAICEDSWTINPSNIQ